MDHRANDLQQNIEETRHDIEETRASMSDKLELLEERVRDTLEDTKTAVEDMVENVKSSVDDTVDAVKETVDDAKLTVEHIVENMKETMDDTMTRVKQSFDLRYQVDQHPWLMLGAAVVTGSVLASFLHPGHEARASSSYAPHQQNVTESREQPTHSQMQQRHGWGTALGLDHEDVVDLMKGAVIGTVMGTVREMIRQNLPSISVPFDKMVNTVAKKLGTGPIESNANHEQTTGSGHATENSQSPSKSYAPYGSMQEGEPYGRAQ